MNQPTNICPQCGNDTKIVPSGISKRTGKPYASFISCTSRDCKFTDKVPNPIPVIPDGTPTGTEVPETPKTEGIPEVMDGLRKIYLKIDEIENKLVDKALQLEYLERKIDSFK